MSGKKANANSAVKATKKWGTPKCHTYPPVNSRRRKNPIWTAQAIPVPKSNPFKEDEYTFSYIPLVDFDTSDAYVEDLKISFEKINFIKGYKISNAVIVTKSNDRENLCNNCSLTHVCPHEKSFLKVCETHCTVEMQRCPYCGQALSYYSNLPTNSPPISDVRLKGHPTVICFDRDIVYKCDNCGKTISGPRIPCVQEKKRGKITLRLIRSLFELSISKIPNKYVAEGYALPTARVNNIVRKLQTKTKEEFETRLIDLFSRKNLADFYDEPVFLDQKEFRAIFTKDKENLLAILSGEELASVFDFVSGRAEELCMFKSAGSFNLTMQFVLTAAPVERRTVIASSIRVFRAYSLDLKEDAKSGFTKRLFDLELISEREKRFNRSYAYFRTKLARFIHDAFCGWPVDLENFDWEMGELGRTIPPTYKRTLKQLELLKEEIKSAYKNYSSWRDRFSREEQPVCDWKSYSRGEVDNMSRLDVSKLIESCSEESKLSVSEQLARMQYYNELAVSPLILSLQTEYPIFNERGFPVFYYTLLGTGIPVKCLEHMLRNGLIAENLPAPACIRQRLELARNLGPYAGCKIEECPFL